MRGKLGGFSGWLVRCAGYTPCCRSVSASAAALQNLNSTIAPGPWRAAAGRRAGSQRAASVGFRVGFQGPQPSSLLPAAPQEDAANAFIQEHLVPQLVAANVTTVVDILRKPTADSHPGEARPCSARSTGWRQAASKLSACLWMTEAGHRRVREAFTNLCR